MIENPVISRNKKLPATTVNSNDNVFCVFQCDQNYSQKPNQLSTYYSTQEVQNTAPLLSQNQCIAQQTISSNVTQNTFQIKRRRMVYSSSQMLYLESLFAKNKYLDRTKRLYAARQLNLSERQIKVWYQNKRMKEKRMQKKMDSFIGTKRATAVDPAVARNGLAQRYVPFPPLTSHWHHQLQQPQHHQQQQQQQQQQLQPQSHHHQHQLQPQQQRDLQPQQQRDLQTQQQRDLQPQQQRDLQPQQQRDLQDQRREQPKLAEQRYPNPSVTVHHFPSWSPYAPEAPYNPPTAAAAAAAPQSIQTHSSLRRAQQQQPPGPRLGAPAQHPPYRRPVLPTYEEATGGREQPVRHYHRHQEHQLHHQPQNQPQNQQQNQPQHQPRHQQRAYCAPSRSPPAVPPVSPPRPRVQSGVSLGTGHPFQLASDPIFDTIHAMFDRGLDLELQVDYGTMTF